MHAVGRQTLAFCTFLSWVSTHSTICNRSSFIFFCRGALLGISTYANLLVKSEFQKNNKWHANVNTPQVFQRSLIPRYYCSSEFECNWITFFSGSESGHLGRVKLCNSDSLWIHFVAWASLNSQKASSSTSLLLGLQYASWCPTLNMTVILIPFPT